MRINFRTNDISQRLFYSSWSQNYIHTKTITHNL